MYLSKEKKREIFKNHSKSENDTGSSESQIALFTLKINKKDYNTERALVKLVGKRRSLLDYLKDKDIERYRSIIKKLNLRK